MSVDGCVKWFDLLRGFGFIEITSGKDSGTDVFVHACDVEGRPLMEGDKVEDSLVLYVPHITCATCSLIDRHALIR